MASACSTGARSRRSWSSARGSRGGIVSGIGLAMVAPLELDQAVAVAARHFIPWLFPFPRNLDAVLGRRVAEPGIEGWQWAFADRLGQDRHVDAGVLVGRRVGDRV